jgi:DHA1 family bicyclomycin/chloramphenicol resistance-like MFS transporter
MQGNPDPDQNFRLGAGEFIAMMAMMQALQALSIDSMLPALGIMARDLGTTDPNQRQLVVGIYLIASGFGALLPGSLADRYGRRPVLFASLGFYFIFCLGCALVQDFQTLLVLRALQAIGSAGLVVLPAAIIRDRFEGDRMARMLSTISVVFMIVPILAPTFGQFILLFAGWRWIFGGIALMAVLVGGWVFLRLPETLHPEYRQKIEPLTIGANMWIAASNRGSIGYVIASALVLGGLFGYINSAQQLVVEHFGAGQGFPLLFAITALGMALANFTNSRIVERFGARRVSHGALLGFIGVSAVQVWAAFSPGESLWSFMPMMAANMCLIGFIGANFGSIALQPFARIAGAAASLQAFVRMVIGSTVGALIGQAYDNTARPLALALLCGGIISVGLVLFSERGQMFRRLLQPGVPRPIPEALIH